MGIVPDALDHALSVAPWPSVPEADAAEGATAEALSLNVCRECEISSTGRPGCSPAAATRQSILNENGSGSRTGAAVPPSIGAVANWRLIPSIQVRARSVSS